MQTQQLTKIQRLVQVVVIIFTIATAPAIVFRAKAALLLPGPYNTIALTLLVAAFVYDSYLFVSLCRATPEYFKLTRLTLQQLPRLLLALAITFLIDMPAYNLIVRNAVIDRAAADMSKGASPASFAHELYERTREELHFENDPVYPITPSPFAEDPSRAAYFALYVMPGDAHTRTPAECAQFASLTMRNDVYRYPYVLAELSERLGKCADVTHHYAEAARQFTETARRLAVGPDEDLTIPFSALFDADDVHASIPTLTILQKTIADGPTPERAWMTMRCHAQYRVPNPRFDGGLQRELQWQRRWRRLFGRICDGLGVPQPPTFIAAIIKKAKEPVSMSMIRTKRAEDLRTQVPHSSR